MIRYIHGKVKAKRISKGSPMKTALYKILEFGIVKFGKDFNNMNRFYYPGEEIIAPYRKCTKARR